MMLLEFFNVLESEEDLKIDKELLTTLAVYRLSVSKKLDTPKYNMAINIVGMV